MPCGDTMWADMETAFEDLPEQEKQEFLKLKVVYSWAVALPHLKRRAEEGLPGAKENYAKFMEELPPIERPLVRKHPITGVAALSTRCSFASRRR